MPLPDPVAAREPVHTRSIEIQAYARVDGLWDLEARIQDLKTFDFKLESGVRSAGQPVHDMHLRVTINEQFEILDAQAVSDAVPYPGHCDVIGPAYRKLVGLNLMRQFRQNVRERLGATQGCTHLTELTQVLPTAAVQAFAGRVRSTQTNPDSQQKPLQLDRCHALASDADAVRLYYPRWYTPRSEAGAAPSFITHSQEGSE